MADTQKILHNEARIIVLANQIAEILAKAGLAQRHGTFLDERCAEIKQCAHAMSVEALIHASLDYPHEYLD